MFSNLTYCMGGILPRIFILTICAVYHLWYLNFIASWTHAAVHIGFQGVSYEQIGLVILPQFYLHTIRNVYCLGGLPLLDMFIGGLLLLATTRLYLSWISGESVIAACFLVVFCGALILIFWFHHIVWLWNLYWYLIFIWIYIMNQSLSCIPNYCWLLSQHTFTSTILKELFPCDTSSTLDYEAVVLELYWLSF